MALQVLITDKNEYLSDIGLSSQTAVEVVMTEDTTDIDELKTLQWLDHAVIDKMVDILRQYPGRNVGTYHHCQDRSNGGQHGVLIQRDVFGFYYCTRIKRPDVQLDFPHRSGRRGCSLRGTASTFVARASIYWGHGAVVGHRDCATRPRGCAR